MKPELLNSLKHYKKTDIFSDLLAGLMVAIIAMPLSIALGIHTKSIAWIYTKGNADRRIL